MIPKGYEWLGAIGPLPRIIEVALRDFGLKEKIGPANSPVILDWAEEIGGEVARSYKADSIPWCGLAMAHWAIEARKTPMPATPLWARSWAKYGYAVPADQAQLGDVLVFTRDGGGGHVGLYIGEDPFAYHVLGGNQGDAVSIVRILKARCIAVRRPPFKTALPASAKRYVIGPNGAPVSENEA